MIYLDDNLEEFIKKHKIEVVTYKCSTCGLDLETTIPVVTSKSYGLVTPKHECENPIEGYTFVPKEKYKYLLDIIV